MNLHSDQLAACAGHSYKRVNVPEPAVEQGAHETEHVGEEGDDLRDDERKDPSNGNDTSPGCPADDSVGVSVLGLLEQTEEDEARADRLGANSQQSCHAGYRDRMVTYGV